MWLSVGFLASWFGFRMHLSALSAIIVVFLDVCCCNFVFMECWATNQKLHVTFACDARVASHVAIHGFHDAGTSTWCVCVAMIRTAMFQKHKHDTMMFFALRSCRIHCHWSIGGRVRFPTLADERFPFVCQCNCVSLYHYSESVKCKLHLANYLVKKVMSSRMFEFAAAFWQRNCLHPLHRCSCCSHGTQKSRFAGTRSGQKQKKRTGHSLAQERETRQTRFAQSCQKPCREISREIQNFLWWSGWRQNQNEPLSFRRIPAECGTIYGESVLQFPVAILVALGESVPSVKNHEEYVRRGINDIGTSGSFLLSGHGYGQQGGFEPQKFAQAHVCTHVDRSGVQRTSRGNFENGVGDGSIGELA